MIKQCSWPRILCGFGVLFVGLVTAQSAGFWVAEALHQGGVPLLLSYVALGGVEAVLMAGVLVLLCRFLLGATLADIRVMPFRLSPFWAVVAVVMPLMVVVLSVVAGGHWEISPFSNEMKGAALGWAVCYVGLATGFVEEAIFRGFLLTTLEWRMGRRFAIIVPSVLFGIVHVMGRPMDVGSFVQMVVAVSLVGILFSLITLETGNIWNAALIHAMWNMIIIGDVIAIGPEASETAWASFVLNSHSFLVAGGDFGIEASLMAIVPIGIFTVLALNRAKHIN